MITYTQKKTTTKKTRIRMFPAALLKIVKKFEMSRMFNNGRIDNLTKLWYSYTMKFYSVIKILNYFVLNMNKSQKHCVEQDTLNPKDYILYNST